MSNTSYVTPYESSELTGYDERDSSSYYAAVLSSPDTERESDREKCREIDRQAAEERARQLTADYARLKQRASVPVVSANLHLKDASSLLRSAPAAGYRVIQQLPRPKADIVILQNMRGDRVAIEQSRGGGVRMHALGSLLPINTLVHRSTLDLAIDHLRQTGREVASQVMANGEVQLLGRTTADSGKGDLHAQIRCDGSVVVDVVGAKGATCMETVQKFAQATGSVIEQTIKKSDYFTLPGELRREKVQAR